MAVAITAVTAPEEKKVRREIVDVATAQKLGRMGYRYVWEMDRDRPTGRCIVFVPSDENETFNILVAISQDVNEVRHD